MLLAIGVFFSCGSDDRNNEEEPDVFLGCCSANPVFGENVDNLDQSLGVISVDNLFTPNGDGYNDLFGILNIELYDNHTVTIYNSDDQVVFESSNYGVGNDFFPLENQGENGVDGIPDGTYKYKVVVQDEQTFFKSGTFCLFTNNSVAEQNFSDCDPLANGFDPIISGN